MKDTNIHFIRIGQIHSAACAAKAFACLFLISTVGLTGCHITWPWLAAGPVVDNAGFMNMWKTYQHCRASSEPVEIRADVEQLHHAAQKVIGQPQASSFLPAAIWPFLSPLPSRLAVDPYAMTVACAVHGSEVARTAGQPEMERELLMTVVAAAKTTSALSDSSSMVGNLRQYPIDSR